jgi:hypothetical protein
MPNNKKNDAMRQQGQKNQPDGMNDKNTPSDDPKRGGGSARGKQSSQGGQGQGKGPAGRKNS